MLTTQNAITKRIRTSPRNDIFINDEQTSIWRSLEHDVRAEQTGSMELVCVERWSDLKSKQI